MEQTSKIVKISNLKEWIYTNQSAGYDVWAAGDGHRCLLFVPIQMREVFAQSYKWESDGITVVANIGWHKEKTVEDTVTLPKFALLKHSKITVRNITYSDHETTIEEILSKAPSERERAPGQGRKPTPKLKISESILDCAKKVAAMRSADKTAEYYDAEEENDALSAIAEAERELADEILAHFGL